MIIDNTLLKSEEHKKQSANCKPRDFLDFPSGGEKKAFRNFDDKLEQWRCPQGLKTAKESQMSQAHFLPGLVCVFVTSEKFAEKKTEGQPIFRKILLLLIWNKMS